MRLSSTLGVLAAASLLSGCAGIDEMLLPGSAAYGEPAVAAGAPSDGGLELADGADAKARAVKLRQVIAQQAQENAVPVALAHAVIRIESNYNPKIVHGGNYGLMQIKLATARSLGFGGSAAALLDPATNLHFGLKYLAGAYQQAGGDLCRTIMKYQSGHLALRMSLANRKYCERVKTLMASST